MELSHEEYEEEKEEEKNKNNNMGGDSKANSLLEKGTRTAFKTIEKFLNERC